MSIKPTNRLRAPAFLQRPLDRRIDQANRIEPDAYGFREVSEDSRAVLMEDVRQEVARGQGGVLNSFSIKTGGGPIT